PKITAVVTALDANGVPARGLAAQFQAFDGSTSLTVSSVQAEQNVGVPLSVAITIDISGSMQGEPLARAKDAATAFVRSLAPNDQASIIAFNGTVTTLVGFTTDRSQLTAAIAGLQANGGTALYEAVQTSAAAT